MRGFLRRASVRSSNRRAAARASKPALQPLESRALRSLSPLTTPTADEQYMLERINLARSNPAAEAARLLQLAQTDPALQNATRSWNLDAFAQTLASMPPLPPLAFNTRLIAAARAQDSLMLATNTQQHSPSGYLVDPKVATASDGLPYFPLGRARDWSAGENVFAYTQNLAGSSMLAYVDYLYAGLMIDWGNPDFGHLHNLMAPGPSQAAALGQRPYNQVGIGLLNGQPTVPPPAQPEIAANRGLNVGPVLVTQEFAWKPGQAFLTGVAYQDRDNNHFYTPGEGLGDVTIRAVGLNGQGTYSVQTWTSGGYSLALPPGAYAVSATGDVPYPQATTVNIGIDNVGWDVVYGSSPPSEPAVPANPNGDGKTGTNSRAFGRAPQAFRAPTIENPAPSLPRNVSDRTSRGPIQNRFLNKHTHLLNRIARKSPLPPGRHRPTISTVS